MLVSLLHSFALAQAPAERDRAEAELVQVADAIDRASRQLEGLRQQESSQQTALREASRRLSVAQRELAQLRQQLIEGEAELQSLASEQRTLTAAAARQRDQLTELQQAVYAINQETPLQRLLDPEDFETVGRRAYYARLLNERYAAQINELESTLAGIDALQRQREQAQLALQQQRDELDLQLSQLDSLRQQQADSLTALQQSIGNQAEQLEQLQASQAQLQQLVDELRIALEGIRSFDDVPPISESRGTLPAPVSSPVTGRFGESFGGGGLARQGVEFRVEVGTPVLAVHPGQVVYADFLQGRGMLVIVDHGQDYLSLYGNNEAVAVSPGDWVDRSDILATSGLSPRDGQPSVYFEIRRSGQAQNPLQWLQTP